MSRWESVPGSPALYVLALFQNKMCEGREGVWAFSRPREGSAERKPLWAWEGLQWTWGSLFKGLQKWASRLHRRRPRERGRRKAEARGVIKGVRGQRTRLIRSLFTGGQRRDSVGASRGAWLRTWDVAAPRDAGPADPDRSVPGPDGIQAAGVY